METPLGNITAVLSATVPVASKTGSVMNKDACAQTCSVEECAKEHLWILVAMFGLNLVFLIFVILCICTKRDCCNKSSRKDIESIKITTLERKTADHSDEQSPTAISPVPAPPRKPLPLPPTHSQQPSSTDTEHPTYLEIISDNSLGFQEQSLGNDSNEKTPGSKRALIPPPGYRQPTTSQSSSSMTNTTDDYEIAWFLEPRDGLRIQNTGPYAELRFQGRESRSDSATKSKGYLGLNSLTRIRAKMKRNRTGS